MWLIRAYWRDVLAELIVLPLMLILAVALLGGSGGGGMPVQFGTAEMGKPAPDALEADAAASKKKVTAPIAKPPQREQGKEERPEPRRPPAKPAGGVLTDRAGASLADNPEPSPVEKSPRPVEKMTSRELEQTVENYRDWVHTGRLDVLLNFDEISASQVSAIAEFFVLKAGDRRVKVELTGDYGDYQSRATGRLVTDVPRDKWPPVLERTAREVLGDGFRRDAVLYLSLHAELRLYRLVGRAVQMHPGTKNFVLKLRPASGGGVDIELAFVETPATTPK